jgi:hypothetical protein
MISGALLARCSEGIRIPIGSVKVSVTHGFFHANLLSLTRYLTATPPQTIFALANLFIVNCHLNVYQPL